MSDDDHGSARPKLRTMRATIHLAAGRHATGAPTRLVSTSFRGAHVVQEIRSFPSDAEKRPPAGEVHAFGPVRIDVARHVVTRDGHSIALAPKTFELLLILMRSGGRALSRQELVAALWPDTFVEEANLSFQVSTLRKALGDGAEQWIETVPKVGYRFTPAVTTEPTCVRAAQGTDVVAGADETGHVIDAEAIAAGPPAPTTAAVKRGRKQRFLVAAAVSAATVAGTVAWNLTSVPAPASRAVARLAVPVTPGQPPAALSGLALSADGRRLVYVADGEGRFRLSVRDLGESEPTMLPGTEGARYPFVSPDDQWIAFFANGKLNKIPIAGGPVVSILDLSSIGFAFGGVWGPDDAIFFASAGGIWKISSAGGSPELVTPIDRNRGEINYQLPFLLPDGGTLLYTVWYGPGWDEKQIVAQRLSTGERHVLVRGAGTARYAPSGHLIYTRAGALMAMRFDASRLEVSGAPITLLEDLREGTPNADYALSPEGTLAYVQQSPGARDRLPVLVGRNGVAQPLPGVAPAYYQNPTFSPDGRRLALNVTGALVDVWIYDFERASLTRLTTEGSSQDPVWSPDGKRIAYRATRSGSRNLFCKNVERTTPEQRLTTGDRVHTPWSWSPDGTLAYEETGAGAKEEIWMLPLAGDRKPRPFLREPFSKSRPRFSPDGSWLAYVSDRSGRAEVYVQSYPATEQRWQISTDGGQDPTWARSGRELFYRNGRQVMSVEIAGGSTLSPSTPRVLFEGDYVRAEPVIDFDVHPDGQQFVMIQQSRRDPPVTYITLVLNWVEELKRRLPPAR